MPHLRPRISLHAPLIVLLLLVFTSSGCKSREKRKPQSGPLPAAGRASNGKGDSPTMAIVSSTPIRRADLMPLLIESAGGEVLTEVILDVLLTRELERRQLTLTPQEIEAERQRMLGRLSEDPDESRRMLDEVLRRRRMGRRRLDLSLRQTAALRKLIADEAQISDAMVRQAYEQQQAPSTECRLILVDSLQKAQEVLERLEAGESFIDLAIRRSTDPSRNQGGLLPLIAPGDVTFPAAITAAAAKLEPGQISDPIALEAGFALLRCERKIAPQPVPFEQAAERIRADLQLSLERTLMERQYRALLESADITVLDAELDAQFKERRRQVVQP